MTTYSTAATRKGARSAHSRPAKGSTTAVKAPPSRLAMDMVPQPKKRYTEFTRPSRWSGMIVWRRDTVMTFHIMTKAPTVKEATQTSVADEVRPVTICPSPMTAMDSVSHVPGGSLAITLPDSSDPVTAPTAKPVMSSPKPWAPTPRTSWAKSTKMAPPRAAAPLSTPKVIARGRSRLSRHR